MKKLILTLLLGGLIMTGLSAKTAFRLWKIIWKAQGLRCRAI